MINPGSRNRELLTALRRNAAVLIAYLALSAVVHPLPVATNATHVLFSPAGIALGALLLYGFALLPAVAIGAFVAAFWHGGVANGLILSAATTLGASCGYILIGQFGSSVNQLRTLPKAGVFLFAAALVTPLISAVIGSTGLNLTGALVKSDMFAAGIHWWLSDSLSALLLIPAVFAARGFIGSNRSTGFNAVAFNREAALIVAFQGAIACAIFLSERFEPLALIYLLFPGAALLALRHELTSTAISNLIAFTIVIAGGTAYGAQSASDTLLLHFSFVILLCSTLLIVAGARQRSGARVGAQGYAMDFLDDILNAVSTPVVVKDEAHRFILLNDAALQFVARTKEQMIGYTDFDIFRPEQASYFQETDKAALDSNSPVEYERDYTRDGVTRRMYVRKSSYAREDGTRVVVTVLTDVTERRAAEEALRESEARFRSLTALSADWYWEQDENLRFTYVSAAADDKSALGERGVIGKTRFELPVIWPSEQAKTDHLERLLAREPFRGVVLRNSGDRFTLISGEPIFDDDGRFKGYRGVGRDVTDIKRAQETAEESRQFLLNLINSVPNPISVKDESFNYLEVNEAFCEMTGLARAKIIGNTDEALVDGDFLKNILEMDRLALDSDEPVTYETGYGNGESLRWYLVRKHAVAQPSGIRILISVFTNLTERKRIEEALQSSELRFRDFAEAAGEYLWETDRDHRFTFVSPRVIFALGYTPEEMLGHLTSEFMSVEEADRVMRWQSLHERPDHSFHGLEHEVIRKNGEIVWLLTNAVAILDENGHFIGHRGTSADITLRKSDEARIQQLATRDALTELPNRILLNDRVERAVQACRRENKTAALLFVDLDHFKHINDSLGHPVGDALLKEVAVRLKQCVRGGDTVSRFGGDEFVVLVEHLDDAQNVSQVAQKILEAIAHPYYIGGQILASGCSIGIAIIPTDGEVLPTLLKNADTAMYYAKGRGRNNFQFFSLEMTQRAVERHQLEMELRGAVASGQLLLHYQPQVDIASGKIVATEALLRWQHPRNGLIDSSAFISVAEESGLIIPIGEWALQTACKQAKQWQQAGIPELRVTINVSPRQTVDPEQFAQLVANELHANELDGSTLEIEMIESPLLKHADDNAALLHELGQLGVTVAVDDFGKGYSSLAHLKQRPINALKIDRSFIRDIESDPGDLAIVKAIIAMARNLKLRVVAEGVETKEQLASLRKLGCHAYQGYYFARPMPADELFRRYFSKAPPARAKRSKRRSSARASASRSRVRTE